MRVVEGLGDCAALDRFLDGSFTEFATADPELRMALGHALDRHDRASRAFEIAYATLRSHWDNPRIHLGYDALFFMGRSAEHAVPAVSAIGPEFRVHGGRRKPGSPTVKLRH